MKFETTKVSPSRGAAFEVLWRVTNEDAYAGNLLAARQYDHLSREDHALLQELVLGVLRWQGRLDYLIERYARRRLSRIDPEVVIALRLGIYQLHFLSRIPPHAAINESVNLVKESGKQSAAPFANAVLRSAQRDQPTDLTQSIKAPVERLSVETSHPAWLLQRWIERFGETEALALALANNAVPRTAFRFNRRIRPEEQTRAWFKDHEIKILESELAPGAAIIESGSLSARSEPVREGWIFLQDEASQLVAQMAAHSSSRLHALDLCAAPGSKTILLAELLSPASMIVAADLHLHRLSTIKELGSKLGYPVLNAIRLDGARDLPFAEDTFDLVLLDAPCTGLGTLSRHPEIKWRIRAEKIDELADLQRRLISQAVRVVNTGGLLVYSVCSTEPEEGEDVVAWFRDQHPEFRDVTRERLIELGLDPAPLLTKSFGARTFPHRQGAEGFFICALWRRK